MAKQHQTLAFIFPGQGSQQVGMLKEMAERYPIVLETFLQASQSLGKDLWELAQYGPLAALNETVNTQPALLTASVALWRAWQQESNVLPKFFAGHSLGEYSALVCAQSLKLEDAVKLVALRGELMQEAVPSGLGGMAAILGMDEDMLSQVCNEVSQNEVVQAANFNAIGQTVISGNRAALLRFCEMAKTKGKKSILLPVSVPSHCLLMKEASEKLGSHLAHIEILPPKIAIIHNVDANIYHHPDDIREILVKQLYLPVQWLNTIERLSSEGIDRMVECGPGKVLSGLNKRINQTIKTFSLETQDDFNMALEKLN